MLIGPFYIYHNWVSYGKLITFRNVISMDRYIK